jgi:hypothetical protein
VTNQTASRKQAIRRVLDGWRNVGWSDHAGAAVAMVDAHMSGGSLAHHVPAAFCVRNDCSERKAARIAAAALEGVVIARDRPTLILPEDIDSFERVAEVSAQEVAAISRPLPTSEAEVRRMLLEIIGEANVPRDHGGERSDAFTTQVHLDGERIATSFVLKGPAKRGELTPKDYGTNGDQLQRSFTQPAFLHVIQTNASLAPSIREAMNGYVLNARARGDADAVASLWDGTDTARILAAYGYIDPVDGHTLR